MKPIKLEMIQLPIGIEMSKYPITQELYERVRGGDLSYNKGTRNPVERVSWYDTREFCNKANALSGLKAVYDDSRSDEKPRLENGFRLPTEKEWLAAAGEPPENIEEYAWCAENSGDKTHPVGTKKPNDYGIFDMWGNVWEWCEDVHPEHPEVRVLRGGSFSLNAQYLRAAQRFIYYPANRYNFFGFRVVRTL